MKCSVLSAAFYSGLFWTSTSGASIPRYFEKQAVTRRELDSAQVQKEIGSLVSNSTVIYGPASLQFKQATSRWTDWNRPRIEAVIEPGVEADVATIVSFMVTTGKWDQTLADSPFPRSNIVMKTVSNI